jgi:aminoglycoside phosphotransferase (APT) family kinase protein
MYSIFRHLYPNSEFVVNVQNRKGVGRLMSDVIVAPETRDLTQLGDQLASWFVKQLPQAADVHLTNLTYPRGAGQSHETILFDASWTEDRHPRSQGYVVRIKPTRHTVFPDDLFEQQYRVMRVMHEHGCVRVARPMWLEDDSSLLGAPFFVMEKKIGRVAVSIPPYSQVGWVADATPAQRRTLWENGVRQLAATQSVPLSKLSFLRGPTPGAEEGLEQEWDKYVRFVAWLERERPLPVLHASLKRLRASWPENQPAGLVWGDARLGNMMFDDNFDVVAVMDWEQPSLGGALHDLAWWLFNSKAMHSGEEPGRPFLAGMGSREETIALWQAITGISTDDIEWYEEFTALKYACLAIRTTKLRGYPEPDDASLARRLKVDI